SQLKIRIIQAFFVYYLFGQLCFAIAKNVTQRKQLENQKEELFAEISKINQDLENFARMASHNLRSPVANILGLFDLIDYSEIENKDTLNIINLIKKSTQKVSATLEEYINELVKKETHPQLNIQEIRISECLNIVIQSVSGLINQNNAKIEQDFTAFDKIDFNKSYFESVLLNLLTNALKYKKPKSDPQITFKTICNGNIKQLEVSDKGIGLDLERFKNKIFGLNQTFHGNKDAKGVGLFLVKKHITDMGGDITIESKKNEGAKFIITFKS
ncbi:sensor histidine kinase, partial [Pedobacter alpinus]